MTIEKKIIVRCSVEELNAIKKFMDFLDNMDDNIYKELIANKIVSESFYDETFSLYNLMKNGDIL